MLPFRVLIPFLFIAGSSLLAVVFALLILGNSTDRRAHLELQQQLDYAFHDQQQRMLQQLDRLNVLYTSLPVTSFLEVLPFQLQHQCLLWKREDEPFLRGRCSSEEMLTSELLSAVPEHVQASGLAGYDPAFFYQFREVDGYLLWLVQPLDQPLLAQWQELYQLPYMELKPHRIIISGEDRYSVPIDAGESPLFLHYSLPRPGQELVQSAIMPLMVVLMLMLFIGLFTAHQLWRLINARERSENRLRQVIDLVPHMIYARDEQGRFILANKATGRFFHVSPERMLGRNLAELTGDNQAYEQFLKRERGLLSSGDASFMEEEVLPGKDGPSIWQTSKLHFNDTDGQPAILSVSIDMTAQREQQRQLQLLSNALEHSGSAVLISDAQGLIRYTNARFRELSRQPASVLQGQSLLRLLHGSVTLRQKQQILSALRKQGKWRGELKLRLPGQHHYWMMISISPVQLDARQHQPHFVLVAEDITELKLTHQKMEQLALYDTLTGLENRRLFRQQLHKAIRLAKRHDTQCALLYLDLDHFKRINDTLGHDAGDLLLTTVAERLRRCVRESDSVARLGGDEFTLLLQDVQHPEAAAQVARKVTEQLALPIQLGSRSVIVTTSIGITLAPLDSENPAELLKNADLAMYRAKSDGRNTWQFYTPEMNVHASRLLELETELREALQDRSFEVWYQPQVDLQQKRVVGFEALVRWRHAQRGMVSPAEFIPLAEETGLIVELGHQVLEQACRDIAVFNTSRNQPGYVAVNLSPRQLKDEQLPDYLDALLSQHQLLPRCLELEITESTLMDQMDQSLPILHRIEQLGIALSIDDFGTGYSSLSYLKQLPVHSLKIDRSFVQDVTTDRDDVAIVSAISAMAAKLNLDVVAEGVEQVEQLQILRDCNCNLVQGYYFSPPVPFEKLLEACNRIESELNR
ncbi:sensor domain-containing protein [Marinospirillum alkaliphilum]|uniref:cyclic-guanylate-specific phosphodiesterase n=1 Tax=Marinospirillum alkaliphilum DSM 21637 TaxID=1122209 RepID=A0A1K1YYH7_9GAMM|nr:EAL domain-containing protein [Marinospirillum alkaliphilum]SFX67082.1 PAS domain S-box-containing protein/diguanylate cyclase (GGDEF) domain-containing protein [Marinospirillum alkaliphilum DSM 21637]